MFLIENMGDSSIFVQISETLNRQQVNPMGLLYMSTLSILSFLP